MTRGVAGLVQFFCSGRRSSVVEQLTRNEQVIGSSPIAGSRYGWEAPQGASILIPLSLGERVWVRGLLVFHGGREPRRQIPLGALGCDRLAGVVATDGHGSSPIAGFRQ